MAKNLGKFRKLGWDSITQQVAEGTPREQKQELLGFSPQDIKMSCLRGAGVAQTQQRLHRSRKDWADHRSRSHSVIWLFRKPENPIRDRSLNEFREEVNEQE